jgi:hypothetical protein
MVGKCGPALGEDGVIEVGEGLHVFPALVGNCSWLKRIRPSVVQFMK